MKITKYAHSCLLIESHSSAHNSRVTLFDPGVYSTLADDSLKALDDIIVTHLHPDHMDVEHIGRLVQRFKTVHVLAPSDALEELRRAGISEQHLVEELPGVRLFNAPHDPVRPFFMAEPPEELGIHYLNLFTHPGDSHHFQESMPILALPVTAPWGSPVRAVEVALQVRPKYIIPIHDWHWSDAAREQMYGLFEKRFASEGITFLKPQDGMSFDVNP